MGAELAVTYLNDKALPHVQPLAEQVRADLLMPLNLLHEGELEAVFERLEREWGALDFVLHSIASRRARTCTAASPTARAPASCRPWTCPAGPSSAWPSWPSR